MTKSKHKKRLTVPRSIRQLFPQVEYAVDATKPIHVSVDAKDCKEAKKLDPTGCALARAAKRELKADGVIIGISSSYVIRGKQAVRFATSERIAREIVSFDRHQDFAPGDYILSPKPPTARFGEHIKRANPNNSEHKGPGKRIMHKSARVRVLPVG